MVKQYFKTVRRKNRVRTKLKKHNSGRCRLVVTRSNQHIYAQIVDDKNSQTIASASTLDKEILPKLKKGTSNRDAAAIVGEFIAKRSKKAKVDTVVFDRGQFLYHGRIKALAEAAREEGLAF